MLVLVGRRKNRIHGVAIAAGRNEPRQTKTSAALSVNYLQLLTPAGFL